MVGVVSLLFIFVTSNNSLYEFAKGITIKNRAQFVESLDDEAR